MMGSLRGADLAPDLRQHKAGQAVDEWLRSAGITQYAFSRMIAAAGAQAVVRSPMSNLDPRRGR